VALFYAATKNPAISDQGSNGKWGQWIGLSWLKGKGAMEEILHRFAGIPNQQDADASCTY